MRPFLVTRATGKAQSTIYIPRPSKHQIEQFGVWSKGLVSSQPADDERTFKGGRLRREMNQPQPSLLRILAALFIFIIICYHSQHSILFPDPMIHIKDTWSCTIHDKGSISKWLIRSPIGNALLKIISPNLEIPCACWTLIRLCFPNSISGPKSRTFSITLDPQWTQGIRKLYWIC